MSSVRGRRMLSTGAQSATANEKIGKKATNAKFEKDYFS